METLRDLREQAGISAKEVADKLGVTRAMIYHYESGYAKVPIDFVLTLCELYDCTERELILAAMYQTKRSSNEWKH